ncbi:MAG: CGNR zinc finger domain-containing protein [Burkholderiales bacterium]|nr:CGNR zinc finger domain-containing protein [Burkholderiales bacterium]
MRGSTPFQRARGKLYAETFRCPGGALCLDFCNSGQGYRSPSAAEWIVTFDDLVAWLEAAGVIAQRQAMRFREAAAKSPAAAAEVQARAIGFREALYRVLEAKTRDRMAAQEDLARIEAEDARVKPFTRLTWNGETYSWSLDPAASDLDAALQPIVSSAMQLLASDKLSRLGRCGNETCFWLFLDETRNRSRRWCEMASCGNLLKVRRHRERLRGAHPHDIA